MKVMYFLSQITPKYDFAILIVSSQIFASLLVLDFGSQIKIFSLLSSTNSSVAKTIANFRIGNNFFIAFLIIIASLRDLFIRNITGFVSDNAFLNLFILLSYFSLTDNNSLDKLLFLKSCG